MIRIAALVVLAPLGLLLLPLTFGSSASSTTGLPSHPDIPEVAMRAYVAAARDPGYPMGSCVLSWALLAAIGRVETDHGRYGGSSANQAGIVAPPILGVVLDGSQPGTTPVVDTDQGIMDGNDMWDRAVGPLQFIPQTWFRWARDLDGDGGQDPHNLFDAAGSAAAYLCAAAGGEVSSEQGIRQAVGAYNQSLAYVETVLDWMRRYLQEATYPSDATSSGSLVCPVTPPVRFIDSWHFPRTGGRVHLGQDLFAPESTPLVALESGTIVELRVAAGLGGTVIWLRGDSGQFWYYAHLRAFATGLASGDTVAQGQVIGEVGRTGNARTTPPHLHIQWRPSGRRGADENPYSLLSTACPGHLDSVASTRGPSR